MNATCKFCTFWLKANQKCTIVKGAKHADLDACDKFELHNYVYCKKRCQILHIEICKNKLTKKSSCKRCSTGKLVNKFSGDSITVSASNFPLEGVGSSPALRSKRKINEDKKIKLAL